MAEGSGNAALVLRAFDDGVEELRVRLTDALVHLEEIERALVCLRAEGELYTTVPTESWETRPNWNAECGTRNSESCRYLHLVFRKVSSGWYGGPGGRRKVYIGNDAGRIAEARAMAARTARVQHLETARTALQGWVRDRGAELGAVREGYLSFPRAVLSPGVVGQLELTN